MIGRRGFLGLLGGAATTAVAARALPATVERTPIRVGVSRSVAADHILRDGFRLVEDGRGKFFRFSTFKADPFHVGEHITVNLGLDGAAGIAGFTGVVHLVSTSDHFGAQRQEVEGLVTDTVHNRVKADV